MDSSRTDDHSQWLFERRRSATAFLGASAGAAGLYVVDRIRPGALAFLDSAVLALLLYITVYLILTIVVFSRASATHIANWADREERGTVLQRYVLGTAPCH